MSSESNREIAPAQAPSEPNHEIAPTPAESVTENVRPLEEKKVKRSPSHETVDIGDLAELMKKEESRELAPEELFSLAGDFLKAPEHVSIRTFDVDEHSAYSLSPTESQKQFAIVVSEESVRSETVSVAPELQIDRSVYYELHRMYSKNVTFQKWKNNFLQKKLVQHFTKRRMFHVFVMDKSQQEYAKQYEKLMDEFSTTEDRAAREQAALESEMRDLQNKCRLKKSELLALIDKLQQMEEEIGAGLIEDGKRDRYLKRQRALFANFRKMQLVFIKLQNKYNETQDMIDSLANFGPNRRLVDFEQLKNDNRILRDRLEEREMELNRLRKQCQNKTQELAHTREKSSVMNLELGSYDQRLEGILDDVTEAREQLTSLKQERDYYRRQTERLKLECGLIGEPTLLLDLQNAIDEVEEGNLLLKKYKNAFGLASQSLLHVRKEIGKINIESDRMMIPRRLT